MDTTPTPTPVDDEGRRQASRLRTLTAGAALVGVAATAGIGLAIAGGTSPGTTDSTVDAGASGEPAATAPQATAPTTATAPDAGGTQPGQVFGGQGASDAQGSGGFGHQGPPRGGSGLAPGNAAGPGHATSGGS